MPSTVVFYLKISNRKFNLPDDDARKGTLATKSCSAHPIMKCLRQQCQFDDIASVLLHDYKFSNTSMQDKSIKL